VDVERAADLYAQGWTLRQIGAELGLTATTVSQQPQGAGVTMSPNGPRASEDKNVLTWWMILLAAIERTRNWQISSRGLSKQSGNSPPVIPPRSEVTAGFCKVN
jgi:hypothetical protein